MTVDEFAGLAHSLPKPKLPVGWVFQGWTYLDPIEPWRQPILHGRVWAGPIELGTSNIAVIITMSDTDRNEEHIADLARTHYSIAVASLKEQVANKTPRP
jgi:hypothetical protein